MSLSLGCIFVSLLCSPYITFFPPISLFPKHFPSLGCSCISYLHFLASILTPRPHLHHAFLPPLLSALSLLSCLSLCKISLILLTLTETLLMLALAHSCCMACQWMTNDCAAKRSTQPYAASQLSLATAVKSITLLLCLEGRDWANTDFGKRFWRQMSSSRPLFYITSQNAAMTWN